MSHCPSDRVVCGPVIQDEPAEGRESRVVVGACLSTEGIDKAAHVDKTALLGIMFGADTVHGVLVPQLGGAVVLADGPVRNGSMSDCFAGAVENTRFE